MAVSSTNNRNRLSWSDEIGLLPLFLTLVLPLIIGVIVILKCVYNHCCLRKATAKSYTVKPTLKSWKGTTDTETDDDSVREQRHHQDSSDTPATAAGDNGTEHSRSGSATNHTAVRNCAPERVVPIEEEENRPVPPRRTGSSQWRRSHPLVQTQQNSTNDNQINFSGDSQDSRGYTRISVREPLSNIRSQAIRRNGDPHYATVSDDSEEMYAAIEDGDGNYMRIPGDDARHWQERREANSPLPPVPPPLSPVLMNTSESPTSSSTGLVTSDPISTIEPPIYAQVTKVKKTKAPAHPISNLSISNSSASSHTSVPIVPPDPPNEPPLPLPLPSSSSSSIKKRSHHHHHHHSHTAAILDPTDNTTDPRRWSKADINYSEFEVVREPPFPSTSKTKTITVDLMDEDNYNIVQEVRTTTTRPSHSHRPESITAGNSSRSSNGPHHTYSELTKKTTDSHHLKNDGYAEVTKRNSFTGGDPTTDTYSDLRKRSSSRSPTGYYQEIGEVKPTKKRDNLYQKIRRKVGPGQGDESDEDDDDEEDQFYEKVKAKPIPPPPLPPPSETDLPNHSNPSALKHGYEKINPKTTKGGGGGEAGGTGPPVPPPQQISLKPPDYSPSTLDQSDEDGSLYEQVKYPPYERLKESQDDIRRDDEEEDGGGRDNMYEDIGYSRINKSTTKSSQSQSGSSGGGDGGTTKGASSSPAHQDMDNLYARVDMSKKKRNTLQSALPEVP